MATAEINVKPARDQLKPGEVLCEYCTGKCCRYFALPIETPDEYKDFEYIRWYMLHGETTIFCEDDDWYLMVHNCCDHLLPDNRCGIYETRPRICREYTTDDCEYEDQWTYDRYWETPEQMAEYAEAVTPPKKGASLRSPRPPLLPVIG
ncbi:MAG: YkgJ family cysteine cluster protein [Planctomycetales bacterium]|nr:YkgJ family cysteine cluster protein [Planctomycetales bacterium]NIM10057.1 YkgJ family cysteine cluster protein [Planctomycetales bacterium]NIN09498.1 YkgJ family cysteine cluster protein [Planctomycetales bacterium]NIN78609.1 YkgJ family cysteine cluster protein [Planctomycetales bacterium]NIO35803.1 YkgJ family cysteine cluster protein [Planctomycetales bacterium]